MIPISAVGGREQLLWHPAIRIITSAVPARARAREMIVERRVPLHYGWLDTPASSSKGMLT
jgi:hypothetical protein